MRGLGVIVPEVGVQLSRNTFVPIGYRANQLRRNLIIVFEGREIFPNAHAKSLRAIFPARQVGFRSPEHNLAEYFYPQLVTLEMAIQAMRSISLSYSLKSSLKRLWGRF